MTEALSHNRTPDPRGISFEDQYRLLDKAIVEYWHNHMAAIKQARIDRGEDPVGIG